MDVTELRLALFTGNYNYVRDGASQALNRLVGYLERQGVQVHIYAPTTDTPAFEPTGHLVPVPSVSIPGRSEYRIGLGLPRAVRKDLKAFEPHLVHIGAPDIIGHRAVSWAQRHNRPAVASVHTRFETYFRYYGAAWFQVGAEAILRRLYRRCVEIYAPSESMAAVLTDQRMSRHVSIWSRGVDRRQFNPDRRDMAWRRSIGFEDHEAVILFVGRLVLEKGLDTFSDTLAELRERGVPHRALFVGEGPARQWITDRAPEGVFIGHQTGADLARAYASADVMFNPSSTETFGNVTLEAMASGLAVVAARATGSLSLVTTGLNGRLTTPDAVDESAEALAIYLNNPEVRRNHGAKGREISARFDWDEINGALLARYLHVVAMWGRATSRGAR